MQKEFLDLAFRYAERAYKLDEVPVGAVIVKDNQVLSFGFNMKEKKNSVLKHAELIAIEKAEKKLNNWRLDECNLYVTLDPCPMCASAIKQSRIRNVYSAIENLDSNNKKILEKIFEKDAINPSVSFESNLDIEYAKNLLNSFFKKQRNK